jgi:hypothetical protein
MGALKKATICNIWPLIGDQGLDMAPWVGSQLIIPVDMISTHDEHFQWGHQQLMEGNCDALVDFEPNARTQVLKYCSSLHLNPDLRFYPDPIYQEFRAEDISLWHNVSEVILETIKLPVYHEIVARNTNVGVSCSDGGFGNDLDKIGVAQMGAAFIIFVACGVLAVVLTWVYKKNKKENDVFPPVPVAVAEGETIQAKLDRVLEDLAALRNISKSNSPPYPKSAAERFCHSQAIPMVDVEGALPTNLK